MTNDPRQSGRDSVAVVTALLPVYTEENDFRSEAKWDDAKPVLVEILRDKSRIELVSIIAQLGHMTASALVEMAPEDPYEPLQRFARNHVG